MTDPLAKPVVTFDEFCRLVPDGQKADLIDGVIYVASPDSRRSNLITGFLDYLLGGYVAAKQMGGEVFVNRFAFRLTEFRAPEPDLAYVRGDRLHLIEEQGMQGGPDVAVEIVSRDSRHRDYIEKRRLYAEAGVTEYWIVDPIQQRAEFLRLIEEQYAPVILEGGSIFSSAVVRDFWLDIQWLLSDPLPNKYKCLNEIIKTGRE